MQSPSPKIPSGKPLLDAAHGIRQNRPPVWIMRQAGRYLPEYREVREKAGSFLDLCYSPALATEVTLQPLRRFDLDAAILFSDILVIPHALGQDVRFAPGEGPILDPIDETTIATLKPEKALDNLEKVLEAIDRIKLALSENKTLIGFCGAPWTGFRPNILSPSFALERTWCSFLKAGRSTSMKTPFVPM